jgi:putative PIN family toxin of toxin-antitoxin system
MIVVIDTNVVLSMFKTTHANWALFEAWAAGRFHWAVSNEILLEYQEIMERLSSLAYATKAFQSMQTILRVRKNFLRASPSFRFHQITSDPDDDKFADCAIAVEADYIITSDQHFDALIGSGYKPQPIQPAEFIRRHLAGGTA